MAHQVDLENWATTMMLVNIGSGSAPTLTLDLDTDDNGLLDLPAGWSVVDSVGIMDGSGNGGHRLVIRSHNASLPEHLGVYAGGSAYGNVIDVPGTPPTTAGAFYVGRQGEIPPVPRPMIGLERS